MARALGGGLDRLAGHVARFTAAQREELDRMLQASGLAAVHLSEEQIERDYEGFSNRVLGPLFHYQVDVCRSTRVAGRLIAR